MATARLKSSYDGKCGFKLKRGRHKFGVTANGKMASSTMASAAAAQPIQIRVLAASTGATYPISLHPNELRCVFLSFPLLLVCFVFRLVLSEQGAHHGSACTT